MGFSATNFPSKQTALSLAPRDTAQIGVWQLWTSLPLVTGEIDHTSVLTREPCKAQAAQKHQESSGRKALLPWIFPKSLSAAALPRTVLAAAQGREGGTKELLLAVSGAGDAGRICQVSSIFV